MLPWWWIPQRMMSNSVPECEQDNLTGCVSFYTQWIDICVCIRVRGLHLVSLCPGGFDGKTRSNSGDHPRLGPFVSVTIRRLRASLLARMLLLASLAPSSARSHW